LELQEGNHVIVLQNMMLKFTEDGFMFVSGMDVTERHKTRLHLVMERKRDCAAVFLVDARPTRGLTGFSSVLTDPQVLTSSDKSLSNWLSVGQRRFSQCYPRFWPIGYKTSREWGVS